MSALVLALGLPALAGCSSSSGSSTPSGSGSGATGSAAASASSTLTSGANASGTATGMTAAPTTPAPSRPGTSGPTGKVTAVELEPDGLGYTTGGASIRHLAFGTATRTQVKDLLTKTLGSLAASHSADCPVGQQDSLANQSFSAYFNGERFVGWRLRSDSGYQLTTASGIGIASTLADVRASYGTVTVGDGKLGYEFSTGAKGLGGQLSGTLPVSKVTGLWAGAACIQR